MRQEEKDYLYKEHMANGDNAYQDIQFLMKELKGYKKLKNEVKNLEKENLKLKNKLSILQKKLIIKDISKPQTKVVTEAKDLNLNTLRRIANILTKDKSYGIKDLTKELLSTGKDIHLSLDIMKALNLIEEVKEGRWTKYKLK